MRFFPILLLSMALLGCSSNEEKPDKNSSPYAVLSYDSMVKEVESIEDPCVRAHAYGVLQRKIDSDLRTLNTIRRLRAVDQCARKEEEEVDE